MSEIETMCPFCKAVYSVEDSYEGQELPCPNCANSFTVRRMMYQQPQPMYQQPPVYRQPPMYQQGYQPKSRTMYILLGVFLGGWGIHNFYAGYTNTAIIQIAITLFTCGFGGWIWAIIDVCTVTVDANGVPFQQ